MSVEDLRQRVRSVLGVASAEVTMGPNEEPLVRVWTDGTRSEADVQKAIETAMAEHSVGADDAIAPVYELDDGASSGSKEPTAGYTPPAVLVTVSAVQLAKLAVEESDEGVEVRAIDETGRFAIAVVGEGDAALDEAVAAAVSYLNGLEEPTAIKVDTRDMDGSDIVTVLIDMPSGDRAVGAVLARGGPLFNLGRAVNAALSDVR